MRLSHPGRLSQSRAQLEPLLRLAVIPLVSAIIGLACSRVYSLAQSTLCRIADWLSRESRRRSA